LRRGEFTKYAHQFKISILSSGTRTFVNVKKVCQSQVSDPELQPGDKISILRIFWLFIPSERGG
jgi:hypothetical protein